MTAKREREMPDIERLWRILWKHIEDITDIQEPEEERKGKANRRDGGLSTDQRQ